MRGVRACMRTSLCMLACAVTVVEVWVVSLWRRDFTCLRSCVRAISSDKAFHDLTIRVERKQCLNHVDVCVTNVCK